MPERVRDSRTAVRIETVDHRGLGVGTKGTTRFRVRGALPGDLVRVHIEHRSPHTGEMFARVREVVEPSPHRRPSPCPHRPACSGCPLIELEIEAQRRAKLELARRLLADALTDELLPSRIEAAPPELAYRRRARFVVFARGGALRMGAFRFRSHLPVATPECPVVPEPARRAARALLDLVDEAARRGAADELEQLHHLQVRTGRGGEVLATLALRSEPRWLGRVAAAAARVPNLCGLTVDIDPEPGDRVLSGRGRLLWGRPSVTDTAGGVAVELDPYTFCQPHGPAADLMVDREVERALSLGVRTAVDLYSGVGPFAAALARGGASVTAVEAVPQAVDAGRRAMHRSGLEVRFALADAASFVAGAGAPPDLAVLDPPRRGLGEVADMVGRWGPHLLLLVSCDLRAAARDLRTLSAHGYRVRSLSLYDLLVHTQHVECAALLERESG